MSATTLDTIPFIDVTKSGVTRSLPVQIIQRAGQPDRAVPLSRTPKTGYPQPTSIGSDPAARRNYDIDEIIFADWSGGMGEDTYPPQTAPTSFQWSQCETRYHGVLACRPLPTKLGAAVSGLGNMGGRVVELNFTNAQLLTYSPNVTAAVCSRYSSGSWTAIQDSGAADITHVNDHAVGLAGIIICTDTKLYRSVDGSTWDDMAIGAISRPSLLAFFDEKAWCLSRVTGATPARYIYTAYSSADVMTVAAGGGTWTAGNSFSVNNTGSAGEFAEKLFTWRDPNDSGRDTLWCLTSRRLLYYDYYAQTPVWVTFFQRRTSGWVPDPDCHVWGRNGNLYVAWGDEYLWEFTGNTIDNPDPNGRGGIPRGLRLVPMRVEGNGHTLVVWCKRNTNDTSSALGATLAMTDAKTFHHLLNGGASTQVDGQTYGGGIGLSAVWTVQSGTSNFIYEQPLPDESSIPQHAAGRTYDTETLVHRSAWIHGGFRNVWKNLRYVELDSIKDNGQPGLNAGATVVVQVVNRKPYASDQLAEALDATETGIDVDTGATFAAGDLIQCEDEVMYVTSVASNTLTVTRGWGTVAATHADNTAVTIIGKTLATLTDASTYPAVCTVTGGIDFKECQIWLALTRGTATSATPLIRAMKVGYRPRPKQRYTYAVRLDLRDESPAFGTPGGQFKGYSASSLRTWLDELNDSDDAGLPDALVTLAYGGEGWSTHPRRRSIADCEVLVTAQEDAEGGDGIYLAQFNDVSAPASG